MEIYTIEAELITSWDDSPHIVEVSFGGVVIYTHAVTFRHHDPTYQQDAIQEALTCLGERLKEVLNLGDRNEGNRNG